MNHQSKRQCGKSYLLWKPDNDGEKPEQKQHQRKGKIEGKGKPYSEGKRETGYRKYLF